MERRATVLGALAVALFLVTWEAAVDLGFVDRLFLSAPSAIARKFVDNFFRTGSIYPDLAVSGREGLLGFGLAVAAGVPVGILMGRVPTARHVLEPFIMALYSTPMVALLPLFILWMGIGLWSKVMVIFLGGVFAIVINTEAGVESADRSLIEMARSFTATRLQILMKIVLPSAVPFIIAGIRLAIGRILIMIVVAEMYAANKGIGFLIMQAGAAYDTAQLFVGVVILAGTGIVLSRSLRAAEKRIAPWLYSRED